MKFTELGGLGEVIDPKRRLILIDPGEFDADFAVAHTMAHLDLGHHLTLSGELSPALEADADWLARYRFGMDWA